MATITEEELQAKRENVEKLRQQIAAKRAKQSETAEQVTMEIQSVQLDAEAARLQAELDALGPTKVTDARTGAAAPLQAAKDTMAAAVEQSKAAAAANDSSAQAGEGK